MSSIWVCICTNGVYMLMVYLNFLCESSLLQCLDSAHMDTCRLGLIFHELCDFLGWREPGQCWFSQWNTGCDSEALELTR